MATETEIKLSLTTRAAQGLAKHPLLAGVTPQRQLLVNTYYDTADGRLRQERVVVRHRLKGRLWLQTVKTVAVLSSGLAQRGEWELPSRPGHFDFAQVDDDTIRTLLESVREQLQPMFTTRFVRHTWLLERGGDVAIEVALDRGWIEAQGRRRTIREIELELLGGTVGDLFALAGELQQTLLLHPEASSKSDRAYRLLANAPLAPVKAIPIPLSAETPSIAAFQRVSLSCLTQLQSNEEGVCQSEQPEFVHQARVAMRRLRSAIRLWEPLLPESFVTRFDLRWQAMASQLGEARNWDVFIAETLPLLSAAEAGNSELERLARYSAQRRLASRRAARTTLKSADYCRLLIEYTAAVLALPEASDSWLAGYVPRCLNRRLRRVGERTAEALSGDVAARHRLRVAFKQLRYALEFFAPLLPASSMANYLQTVTALQDLLGHLNDLAVARGAVVAALPGRRGQPFVDWLAARMEALRPELADLMAILGQQTPPWQKSVTAPAAAVGS